eukprot:3931747-Rhodomonas_salina.2
MQPEQNGGIQYQRTSTNCPTSTKVPVQTALAVQSYRYCGGQVKGVQLYISDFQRPITERLQVAFRSNTVGPHVAIFKKVSPRALALERDGWEARASA